MPVSPHRIVDFLRDEAGRPLKPKELARGLEIDPDRYDEFRDLLRQLEETGVLYRVKKQRYAAPQKINLLVGRLQTIRSGAGFVVPEQGGEDLFIPHEGLASAVDGDRVVARVESRRRRERPQGQVIRVLERSRRTIVGVYHPAKNFGFVTPEDRKLTRDVFVPPGQEAGAADGDVVVVAVTEWGDGHKGPVGEVERVLGPLDAPGVDVLTVVHGHELPTEFPAEVEAEARRVAEAGVPREELDRRLDLRDTLVFTIDPADAKDHDDALSLRPVEGGLVEVGIHIADVSHYIPEGGAIDREARARGTSVYLVDRVIPMLPEALSNDLCSLRPDVDRLALSLLVRLDAEGAVHGHRLVRSVLRCAHRLSYEDAQAILDGERSAGPELTNALRQLLALSRKRRARRTERGSLDFDLPEARVVLGPEGVPVDIQRVQRLETHKLIEDFMLLANETIAARAVEAQVPLLYRVHDAPAADRVALVRDLLATFGLRLGGAERPTPKDYQRVLSQVHGRPEEGLVSTVILRSMKQARYAAESSGHFGLAADHYTHFTSPIRRYPDLVVHRLAGRAFIEGRRIGSEAADALADVARTSSERERVAVGAERDSIDLKKVEFMQRHLEDEFEGTISGVTAFGVFVLLDRFFVEGLVHVSSLDDDYYAFVEEQFALLGENTRRRLQLGDRVAVRVARVDPEERKIDFDLVEHEGSAGGDGRRAGRPAGGGAGSGGKGRGGSGGKARGGSGGKGRGKGGGKGRGKGGKGRGKGAGKARG